MTRIAIVGTGIAGLAAAHRLYRAGLRDLRLFEAGDHIGGHTATVDVTVRSGTYAVDTGFIVHNRLTYPGFSALLDELGVATRSSTMSFGVRDDVSGLEYAVTNARAVFAQTRNLLRRDHWSMLGEIVRFNRQARELLARDDETTTLDDYLTAHGFSAGFRERFILPMGAAIWSSPTRSVGRFPARFFVEFFANHRFLDLAGRPEWRVVAGGSREYIAPLTRPFADRIWLRTPVTRVVRRGRGVELTVPGSALTFDHVVLACHSDQALQLLGDATAAEREVLGAIPYQTNDVVLHSDTSVLPRSRRAWAAWNCHVTASPDRPVCVTYDMNLLQRLTAPERFCVTLNPSTPIQEAKVHARFRYAHPVYTVAARAAQQRWAALAPPTGRTWYAGAYWFHGFHEDGLRSGYRAADALIAAAREHAITTEAVA